jgi:trimeric autotransporter adhesin
MRNFPLSVLFVIAFSLSGLAQVPQAIPYQAVARDNAGVILANQNISIRCRVRDLTVAGTILYSETHNVTTNNLGLFALNIGNGTVTSGSFSGIIWSSGSKFLQVEMDPSGGSSYIDMGTQQLLSVPYALSAGSSSNSWSTTGNTGLSDTTNFIGTINSNVLNIKVGNQKAGKIDLSRSNTFLGINSGNSINTGLNNTGIGARALFQNINGNQNTAIGSEALYSSPATVGNVAVGYQSQANANSSLIVNNGFNTSIGYSALLGSVTPSSNTGVRNTAIGSNAIYSNSSGSDNASMGSQSMYNNTTGNSNTAMGQAALFNNTTGAFNVAYGANALFNNVAGMSGVAIGVRSQYYANNTPSTYINSNTSVGHNSLEGSSLPANNTGTENVAFGYDALKGNSSGNSNSAIGSNALKSNTSGSDNTACGRIALSNNTLGNSNTAVGLGALISNALGSFNTAIGRGAGPDGLNNLTNTTCIGYNALATVNNALILGNTSANVGIGLSNPTHKLQLSADDAVKPTTNTWTIISDLRLKNIDGTYTKGLQEILQLKPLLYHYKNTGDVSFSEKTLNTQSVGFLAQDVQQVFPECVSEDANGYLNLNIHAIIIAQVNAIREQQEMIEELKKQNELLKNEINSVRQLVIQAQN